MTPAAGILFVAGAPGAERVLLLRRSADGDHAGEWDYPGGKLEDGETAAEAARREAREEVGFAPDDLEPHARRVADCVDYTTFVARVAEPFDVALSPEHDAHAWVPVGEVAARSEETRSDSASPPLPEGVRVERVDVLPDRAAGRYDPETKTVELAKYLELGGGERRALANPARLAAHEAGHAWDHALGWPSRDPELKDLLAAAQTRLEPVELLGAAYYLADPGEAFAEAWAFLKHATDGDGARWFGTLEPARVEEALGDVVAWVKGKSG